MEIQLDEIKTLVTQAAQGLLETAGLEPGDVFVLGCSSSEICGGRIGKASDAEVGEAVVSTLLSVLRPQGIYLAVQGCEHINRALVIEKEAAKRYGLETVTVLPALHAGGACAVAAYGMAEAPVVIEHVTALAGMDIGDTSIGMHVRHVQIPVRLPVREIGGAHVTYLRSRPKLIGGERAEYPLGRV